MESWTDGRAAVFREVRSALQSRDLVRAEGLLRGVEDHCAEWHFLMGAVCFRKGWMDEAQKNYKAAAWMEPENPEYRLAVKRMEDSSRYRPDGKSFGTLCAEGTLISLASICVLCKVSTCCCGCGTCMVCCQGIDRMPR